MKHSLVCILLIAVLCLTSCQNIAPEVEDIVGTPAPVEKDTPDIIVPEEVKVIDDTSAPIEKDTLDIVVPTEKMNKYQLHPVAYPKMVQFPMSDRIDGAYNAWSKARYERRQNYTKDAESNRLFVKSASCFLTEKNGKNKTYSPINIYFALSMLAEVTEGDTRAEILSALGYGDIETLRKTANGIWDDNYCDDGSITTRFGNSFWLSDKLEYREESLKQLAKNYYASSFSGEMGDLPYTQAFQNWINEQTGGLLKAQAEKLKFSKDTVMALVSTLYFKGKWSDEFDKENTKADTFHAPSGNITCDFMNRTIHGNYYVGKDFGAMNMRIENGGDMWLILPDKGKSPEELIANGQATEFLSTANNRNQSKSALLNVKVPKFDVTADLEISKQLRQLGIQKVFKGGDFSPLTEATEVILDEVKHAARVKIDEEGCEAAAFTSAALNGCAMLPEKMDFVLDRPFIFAITSESGCVLFAGVVNQPNQ